MARGHGLVIEGLRVEIDSLVLIDSSVAALGAKCSHVVRFRTGRPSDRMVVLWILSIGGHVCDLKSVYSRSLVSMSSRRLNEALEI